MASKNFKSRDWSAWPGQTCCLEEELIERINNESDICLFIFSISLKLVGLQMFGFRSDGDTKLAKFISTRFTEFYCDGRKSFNPQGNDEAAN